MALPLKIYKTFFLFLILLALPLFGWERVYSAPSSEKINTISHAWDGGYVIAGYTMPMPGSGLRDFLFMKIDEYGNIIWSRSYGSPIISETTGQHILTTDSCYIGVSNSSFPYFHPWVLKLNQMGDTLWSKEYLLSGSSAVFNTNMDSDSGFILTGWAVVAEAGVGSNYQKFLFMRFNSDGDTIWVRKYAPDSLSHGYQIKQTESGDFLACGSTQFNGHYTHDVCIIKVSQAGDSLWARTYDFFGGIDVAIDFVFTTGDSAVVVGCLTLPGEDKTDLLIMHIDEAGNLLWWKSYGGLNSDKGMKIIRSLDGGFIVLGNSFSDATMSFDIWLLKLDEHGDTLWTRKFGEDTDKSEYGADILETEDGGYIIAGYRVYLDTDIADPLVIRVDSLGHHVPSAISENPPAPKPEAFEISAYPNPFNSSVTITLDCHSREIGNPDNPIVEIYDVAGRLVANTPFGSARGAAFGSLSRVETTFADNSLRPHSESEYVWHPAPSLGSGVYLIHALSGDGNVATKRVVYLK